MCRIGAIVHIRAAEPRERSALRGVHKRASYVWAADRANLEAHPDALGVAAEPVAEGRVRVAVGSDNRLLGFAVVAHGRDGVCELDDVFVEPDSMRQGIGRALVEDAAAGARAAGYRQLEVVAHPRNFAFYESVGFVVGEPATTRFGPATRLRRELGTAPRPPAGASVRARRAWSWQPLEADQ